MYCTYLTKLTRASGNAITNSRLYSGPFRLLFCRMSFAKYIMASFFFGFTVTRICKFKTTKKRRYYVPALLLFFNFNEEKKYIPSNDRKNKDNQVYLLNTTEKQYTMEKHKNLCSNRSHLSLINSFFFFNCYLAAPRPTLGHYQGDSLTHPMLITAFFYIFGPEVTGSLVARLGP